MSKVAVQVELAVVPDGLNNTVPAPLTLLQTKFGTPASRSVRVTVRRVLFVGKLIAGGAAVAVRVLK